MRKEPTDNYEKFSLLGNNVYDVIFMHNLLLSQNVSSSYYEKYIIEDKKKSQTLENIAYYFGTRGPILIDNQGLREIFINNGIPRETSLPHLSSRDIINQVDMCLESDAVYVCNASGKLDKYTMFILGYIMANEQEIFFWNEIDTSEWLMSCISKKNNDSQEVVQFPLEMIRSFAYPYLFKKNKIIIQPEKYKKLIVDEMGTIGVERNIEFNLQVENQKIKKIPFPY